MRRCDGVGEGVGSGGAGSLQIGARASETSLLLARPGQPHPDTLLSGLLAQSLLIEFFAGSYGSVSRRDMRGVGLVLGEGFPFCVLA